MTTTPLPLSSILKIGSWTSAILGVTTTNPTTQSVTKNTTGLWRGIWAAQDSDRKSERSRIISPALQQAVESSVAEIEEATFGRGKYFSITDDMDDQDNQDIVYLRTKLHTDLEKQSYVSP